MQLRQRWKSLERPAAGSLSRYRSAGGCSSGCHNPGGRGVPLDPPLTGSAAVTPLASRGHQRAGDRASCTWGLSQDQSRTPPHTPAGSAGGSPRSLVKQLPRQRPAGSPGTEASALWGDGSFLGARRSHQQAQASGSNGDGDTRRELPGWQSTTLRGSVRGAEAVLPRGGGVRSAHRAGRARPSSWGARGTHGS